MRTYYSATTNSHFVSGAFVAWLLTSALMFASPLSAAELDIEFETIARSGDTPIPGGSGLFTGFGAAPAVDAAGNVVFTGTGNAANGLSFQSGVYTFVDYCCQKVADRSTLVPGGGGATFDVFRGADRNDIDGGRVAFVADVSASSTILGVYTNVGQSSANSLVEVALADGSEWSVVSDPWVDGNEVGLRGTRLIPDQHNAFLMWDGTDHYADPGAGYIVSPGTQASISNGAAAFRRYKSGSSQLGVYENGSYDALVTLNSTPIPGQDGLTFSNVNNFPVVDRGGLDLAFRGNGSGGLLGVYKRVDSGALQLVADTDMLVPGGVPIPGWSDQYFTFFFEDGIALANGRVAFWGEGLNTLSGIYSDIGGELDVLVDNEAYNTILLDGVSEQVTQVYMGPKALTLTPLGYVLVFKATLASGETAIIRATINDGAPPDPTDNFIVYKDYSDNNSDSVSVALSCTSGTVTDSPQWANEASPAVFTIEGAGANATCSATETSVALGYSKDESNCQNRALNSSCTIVNTLDTPSGNTFTVYKEYSDNSTTYVNIHLSCTGGTVTNTPQLARPGRPAVFDVANAPAGTTCAASEPWVPDGYIKDESDCQDGDPVGGSCTVYNNQVGSSVDSFTVYKDFSDGNSNSVSVSLSCTSGTVSNNPQWASESAPAVFDIQDASPGASCTATENSVPNGYTKDESDCQDGDALNGSCTIVNVLQVSDDSFTVYKDYSDNNSDSVSFALSCTSGTVTNSPQWANEGNPAVFTIEGAGANATCTATETSVASGYTKDESGCQNRSLNSSCTIVNTAEVTSDAFTVFKDFSDNNSASVSVSLTCTSGTVTNSPRLASEGSPAVFDIEGASPGTSCTASELNVPSGYTADEAQCRDGDPLNSSCTIFNTLDSARTNDVISFSGFESGQSEDWTLQGAYVSSEVAIGNYSLAHQDDGSSSHQSISTVGYENVSVTMSAAGDSLEKQDLCLAELSVNGGQGWIPVASVDDSNDDRSFRSGTVSPPGASNNPDLRMRFRVVGKGKGDYCWGDEVIVMGTPIGGSLAAADGGSVGLQVVIQSSSGSVATEPYAHPGFDPGFDHLIGDGRVDRSWLTYRQLVDGAFVEPALPRDAFGLPAGAKRSEQVFEGTLEATGAGLPAFEAGFLQLGNHLYPVERGASMDDRGDWSFVIETGRVWSENSDRGFSRVSVPFAVIERETGCAGKGAMTFLFREDGTTSKALFHIDTDCENTPFAGSGALEVVYTPAAMNVQGLGLDAVPACAAENWLPLVQGRGGINLVLLPDGSAQYRLSEGGSQLRVDASQEAAVLEGLCD